MEIQGVDPSLPEFEPFYRLKSVSQDVRGSGLGLHGVRVLSRAMGGDVTLELSDERERR